MILRLPRGYRKLARSPLSVAHQDVAADFEEILASSPSLYAWAASHPDRREFHGRGPVYAVPLPRSGRRVVVRHSWRGGMMAPLLRDLWLVPTPAPVELLIASILEQAGVPTPPVAGFATYHAFGPFRRADVVTVELQGSDLPAALTAAGESGNRAGIVRAVAHLLADLVNAGAWHQDLNAKNIILVADDARELRAAVLDVDRIRFLPAGDPSIEAANLNRLRRSMNKLASAGVPVFTDEEYLRIDRYVRETEATRAADRERPLEPGL